MLNQQVIGEDIAGGVALYIAGRMSSKEFDEFLAKSTK
jgi:hypothetical protein